MGAICCSPTVVYDAPMTDRGHGDPKTNSIGSMRGVSGANKELEAAFPEQPSVIEEIHGILADTTHFKGNAPQEVSLDALEAPDTATAKDLADHPGWKEILPRTAVRPDFPNALALPAISPRTTHVRLHIYPDGGVSRLPDGGVETQAITYRPVNWRSASSAPFTIFSAPSRSTV